MESVGPVTSTGVVNIADERSIPPGADNQVKKTNVQSELEVIADKLRSSESPERPQRPPNAPPETLDSRNLDKAPDAPHNQAEVTGYLKKRYEEIDPEYEPDTAGRNLDITG